MECTGVADVFTITVNPIPVISATAADPTACLATDGSIEVVSTSGLSTGALSWTGDATGSNTLADITADSPDITGLGAGTYNITLVDVNGCISNTEVSVLADPGAPSVDAIADQTLCSDDLTTAVTFTGSDAGSTYDWVNDDVATGLAVSGSGDIASFTATNATGSAIVSTVTVTPTLAGCIGASESFTITVNSTPTLTLVDPAAVCSPATVDITAAGVSSTDVGSIAYYSDMAMTIPFFTGTTAGDGIYYIEATNGTCTSSGFVTVTVVTTPVLDPFVPVVACDSYDLPVIMGTDLSGTGAYYDATGGPTVANVVTGPITSDMNIFIYDGASGCSDEQPVSITINPLPAVTNISGEDTYCEGLTVNDILVDVSGTADWNVYYSLDGTSQTATGSASPINLGNAPGVYVLDSVSDAACSNTASGTQTITVNPLPSAPTAGTNSEYCSTVPFADMTASGGAGTMTWYSDAGLTSVISTGPTLAQTTWKAQRLIM